MTDWASAEFTVHALNDPGLHIANLEGKENKRKDELKRWIDARGSWQAWFVKSMTDEWEEEDKYVGGGERREKTGKIRGDNN